MFHSLQLSCILGSVLALVGANWTHSFALGLFAVLFIELTSLSGTECMLVVTAGRREPGVWLGLLFLLFTLRNNLNLLLFVCDYST